MTIAFYISGHGFGHASRDIEIINAIAARAPETRFLIRTAAARWMFDVGASADCEVQAVETDTGMVQIDSLRFDEEETARRAAEFYDGFERRADEEAAHLHRHGVSVVVGDIPPLAFAAAGRAGVGSVAVGNFTWDWIYEGYSAFARHAPDAIPAIREAYSHASRALRLPMHGGFEAMTGAVRDIPLIARRSNRDPADTRRALGLPAGRPVVLASFGGYGVRLPDEKIAETGRFTLVTTDRQPGSGERRGAGGALLRLGERELYDLGLRYEDLVAAADVVVSKPGYGIVSECIANNTALLYTSRGRFVEYDVFVAEMPRVLRCRFVRQEDLLRGEWTDAVGALLEQPPPPQAIDTHGAAVAAEEILSIARTRA